MAHRRNHPRPSARHSRAGRAGQAAFLAWRRSGSAARTRPCARCLRSRALDVAASRRPHPPPRRGSRRLGGVEFACYLAEQTEATGRLPDDHTIVVERFRDELGDWRVVVNSPFGAQVHAPWALAIGARLRERYGVDVQTMHADDGIVLRIPETDEAPPAQLALLASDEVDEAVTREVGGSALFAARFRECAARALLLPRRRPDRRTPLWQQRQRSAQ